MKDQFKTKQALIQELASLKQRITELEQSESGHKQVEEVLKRSQIRLNTILDNMGDLVAVFDFNGIVKFVTPSYQRILGYGEDELIGRNAFEYIHPDDREQVMRSFARVLESGNEREIFRFCHRDGQYIWFEGVGRIMRNEEGSVEGVVVGCRDITERKRTEEALRENEEKFKIIFDKASDGILIADAQNKKFLQGNAAICSMLGYTKEEIENFTIYDIHSPRDIAYVMDQYEKQVAREEDAVVEDLPIMRKDGSIFYADIGSAHATIGGIHYLIGIFRDITERKRIEEALRESENRYRELSIVDDLTQLYNSRHFYFQLKIELDRSTRYDQPLTLLLLDLDNFKAFNDAYGHVEGDQVLIRLGQVVKRCLRETDFAFRYGGEEFTILLPMTTNADGAVTAERILKEFKKEIFSPAPGQDVYMTVSIGLSQYKPQEDMKAFVHRVDQLMYQGKKNGKDRVCCES